MQPNFFTRLLTRLSGALSRLASPGKDPVLSQSPSAQAVQQSSTASPASPSNGTVTPPREGLEDLAELAASICGASFAMIRLVEPSREWYSAQEHLSTAQVSRAIGFCHQVVQDAHAAVVPNLLDDPSSAAYPLLTGPPSFQFYVGLPLLDKAHRIIGRLCVLDEAPRVVRTDQRAALEALARQVVTRLQLQQAMADLTRTLSEHRVVQRRQNAQYAIARILAESPSLADATPRLLDTICTSLDWEVGCLWEVDEGENVLRCVALWHAPTVTVPKFDKLSRQITFAPGIGLPGRVWLSRDAAWIPDVVRDANFPRVKTAMEEGLHGAFGFPIQWNKKVLGVLEFFSREIRPPDQDLLHLFTAIGHQIGQFTVRMRTEAEHQALIVQLQEAVGKVKTLTGLLPVCASCKKVRDDKGYWHRIEKYIEEHSHAEVSHALCRECARKLYPEYYKDVDEAAPSP